MIAPSSPPAPTSQAAAQAALDLLATMVAVVSPEGECEFVNSSFETILGLSRRSMTRGVVYGWFADPQVLRETVAAVSNNAFSTSRLEAVLKRPSGESLPVHVTVNQIDGSRNVVFEIVEIEQQNRQEREERALEQAEATKELIRNLAHEIKNPLGGIRGAAQLLARKADDDTREYLEVIVREVDRITSLIDRLRDLAAPDISQSRGPVDLNRLLHELTLLQGATGEATIELDLDPSLPPIDADADALKRLFLNLLRNALEAPATHVHVATRVETGRRWRDPMGRLHALVTATVEDDGPGILPPDRERLFEPFFTTKAAGTGLGLAAVQRIAHDHSGTIEFEEPASGRGARFVFTIPAVAS